MEVEIQILDTLFRRISPGQILQRLRTSGPLLDDRADRELFRKFAPTDLKGYSLDEHDLFYSRLQTEAAGFQVNFCQKMNRVYRRNILIEEESALKHDLPLPSAALYCVLALAERMLTIDGQDPCCRIEQVLPWREAYLLLGQDLFVCAYMAMVDLIDGRKREKFVWPAVLRTDCRQLNRRLAKGLAENHQHLYGSSQSFALSWMSAMNYPCDLDVLEKGFGTLFQPFNIVEPEQYLVSNRDRVRYACRCRVHLFRWLKGNIPKETNYAEEKLNSPKKKLNNPVEKPNNSGDYENSRWKWLHQLCPELEALEEVNELRQRYGARIPQKEGESQVLDYALEEHIYVAAPDAHYRALAGERYFLYQCFRAFLQGELSEADQGVFYLYLILKLMFRSELIQVNGKVGFHNFSDYQDRKDRLLRPMHWNELYRMAINAPQKEEHVISLETRMVPKTTAKGSIDRVQEADDSYAFANLTLAQIQEMSPFTRVEEREDFSKEGHFYVFHFTKGEDDDPHDIDFLELRCRHQKRRALVKQQAVGLAKAFSESSEFCSRVRGIDAASHEIGCPPEVFAQAYRFLRGFRTSDFFCPLLFYPAVERRLGYTYHAGEDFLDIASALRTIDETVELLELDRGDRIGHALGLGINPEMHYQSKLHRVVMSKQERLDNLVWLIFRGNQLLDYREISFFASLEDETKRLMMEIYGDAIGENNWSVTLEEYFCAMKLRGDDPQSYLSMDYQPHIGFADVYDEFSIRENPELEQYRKSQVICGLYYYYHFGRREKIRGNEIVTIEIDARYVYIMERLQNSMQKYLAQRGIAIECNPSSNVLIGTFGRYQTHPIFRFHNEGLERDLEKLAECSQLRVSINTDDLGVFDTSLEFEYALVFHALRTMTNTKGERLYTDEAILDYLDLLRDMGHEMIFLPAWD